MHYQFTLAILILRAKLSIYLHIFQSNDYLLSCQMKCAHKDKSLVLKENQLTVNAVCIAKLHPTIVWTCVYSLWYLLKW